MKRFKKTSYSGFTLVETFVAISVLFIAVLGPMGLLSKSISDSMFAQNQITSYYLAQEAMEIIVFLRDSGDAIGPINPEDEEQVSIGDLLNNCVSSWCAFDLITIALEQTIDVCPYAEEGDMPDCARLYRDSGLDVYTHRASEEPTNFYRVFKIEIVDIDGNVPTGVLLRSIVGWPLNDGFRKTEVSTFLTLFNE